MVRWSRGRQGHPRAKRALLGPVSVVLLTSLAGYLIRVQYGITGTPDLVLQTLLSSIFFLSSAWAIVRLGSVGAEAIIASPRIRPGTVDGNLVRLGMRLLSLAIGLAILFEGMRPWACRSWA